MLQLIVVGAGGLGREVREYARDVFDERLYQFKGFLDDRPPAPDSPEYPRALPVLGSIRGHTPSPDERFIMAIGDAHARRVVTELLLERGAVFETVVHPRSHISSNAMIGRGSIIAPFASVGAGAQIGEFTHLHFYASAAHDTVIGDFTSLSPYSAANGQSKLGDGVFLGTLAVVNPTKQVGRNSKVTAGSVVYQDVPENSIAFGNPAKARSLMNARTGVTHTPTVETEDDSVRA